MAVAVPIVMAISTVASAAMAAKQGMDAKKSAEYNAKVSEMEAEQVTKSAEFEADKQRQDVERLLASQRAVYGASGIDISAGGSVSKVQQQTAIEGNLDTQAILYNGEIEAARARNAASFARFSGKQQQTAGFVNAGTTLLSGASKTTQLYLKSN